MMLLKKSTKRFLKSTAILMVPLLISCAENTAETEPAPKQINVECAFSQIIYVSKDDVLTEGTAKQIYYNNKMVEKICGSGDVSVAK